METPTPYTEYLETQHGTDRPYLIRTFDCDAPNDEFVWHQDRQGRTVHVLSGNGWELQMEDKLPQPLKVGKDYYIPKMEYHRVIKGEGNLVIRIENI